jgi:hypothetical protein
LWLGASAALLLVLSGSFVHLHLRMRRWQPVVVAGTPVLVTDEGTRGRRLLPSAYRPAPLGDSRRARTRPRSSRTSAHLDARDPQLFTLALALLVFMPWNLPLWWQLRRLRRAIEIDCDARILESGIDAASYGEALVYVGEHRSCTSARCGDVRSRSFLEQRLRIMLGKPVKWRRVATAVLAGTSLCLAALAAQLSPPDATRAPVTRAVAPPADESPDQAGRVAIKLPAATLDRYVGDYAQSDSAFVTVRREGDHLLLDFSSGPKSEILAESEDHFFVKGGDARVVFANDGSGKAPSAALWQMGRALPLTRVDAATVAQFKAKLQARMQSQTPAPRTEATPASPVRRHRGGQAQLRGHATAAGGGAPPRPAEVHGVVQADGPIVSMKFSGVDGGGWDHYEVQRTNGRFKDAIIVGSDGKIAGYFTTQP